MKSPAYHPEPGYLLDYASGSQPAGVSLAIAAHLTLCPMCRREVERFEALGGAAFESLPDAPVSTAALDAAMRRLDAAPMAPALRAPTVPLAANENLLPRPLLKALNAAPDELSWRKLGGFALHRMSEPGESHAVYLIRGSGGTELASHTHEGEEITLVLQGGLIDGNAHLERGDFMLADGSLNHAPRADPEGCLLLAVIRGRMKFDGPLAGLAARWFGV